MKQKKQTECVPGSEKYVKAKNGRTMMNCKCAECGITKTKFVKSQKGGEAPAWTGQWKKLIDWMEKDTLAVVKEPGAKESFDDFWSGKTFSRAWDNITGNHPDPNKGVSYNSPSMGDNYVAPKKPKGCKVITTACDQKERPVSYNCWR